MTARPNIKDADVGFRSFRFRTNVIETYHLKLLDRAGRPKENRKFKERRIGNEIQFKAPHRCPTSIFLRGWIRLRIKGGGYGDIPTEDYSLSHGF
jgi:hypothetical protein